MDAKKIKDTRRQLSMEYEALIQSMKRHRTAVDDIKVDNTEDEIDIAVISHEKDVRFNLYESDFARLQFIEQAMNSLNRGEYGQCVRCGESINEKRLAAMPSANMCIDCQEASEVELASSSFTAMGEEPDHLD